MAFRVTGRKDSSVANVILAYSEGENGMNAGINLLMKSNTDIY